MCLLITQLASEPLNGNGPLSNTKCANLPYYGSIQICILYCSVLNYLPRLGTKQYPSAHQLWWTQTETHNSSGPSGASWNENIRSNNSSPPLPSPSSFP